MSHFPLTELATAPTTPAAGKHLVFADDSNTVLSRDETGLVHGYSWNASVASQGPITNPTQLVTNSDLLIPDSVGALNLQVGARFFWRLSVSKTAGASGASVDVRLGATRSNLDANICGTSGLGQTAVADIGTLNVMCTLRAIGAGTSAVMQGTWWWQHQGTAASTTVSGVGFGTNTTDHKEQTGTVSTPAFDSTGRGGQYFSLWVNPSISGDWTITQAWAEAWWG